MIAGGGDISANGFYEGKQYRSNLAHHLMPPRFKSEGYMKPTIKIEMHESADGKYEPSDFKIVFNFFREDKTKLSLGKQGVFVTRAMQLLSKKMIDIELEARKK